MKLREFIQILSAVGKYLLESKGRIARAIMWKWFAPVAIWRMKRHTLEHYDGIAIVNFHPQRIEWKDFVPRTVEALSLVKQLDPSRFGRLRRQLSYIQCGELGQLVSASYDDRFGICSVDFCKLEFKLYPASTPYIYAAILVHEATHGELAHGEMRATDLRHEGIEHVCDREAADFLKRSHPKAAEIWMRKYSRSGKHQQ